MFFIKKNIYFFFIYFLLILFLFFDLLFKKYEYKHTFLIKNKETLNQITNNLYKERIIDNQFIFKVIIKLGLIEKKLKAGEYVFYGNNILQIIKKISIGDVHLRKITIPEGLTTKEIIDIIKAEEGIKIKSNVSESIREGALFPSTYFYTYGTNFNIIIEKMKKRMDSTLLNAWNERDHDLKLSNSYEVLILASIIEKETSLREERAKIAEVFLNRLKINMRLQSDPTVIYGLKIANKDIKDLKKIHLEHKSDFNTYLNYGLPKDPICNPGQDSIIAVTKPSKGDLLYFVSNGMGGHNFSSNYETHLEYVKKLRKINNEKNKN